MYWIRLYCGENEIEQISAELWERGAVGVQEFHDGLAAAFPSGDVRPALLQEFAAFSPEWSQEEDVDWVEATKRAWPPREIGNRIFLAPPWADEATPPGRVRVIHNPGMASGTGEHPCTQLALEALESAVQPGMRVADIGTGSGILAIAAAKLGAHRYIAVDTDEPSLSTASENFLLNDLPPSVVCGSTECIRSESADVVVANINATVLLATMDDLQRIARARAILILSGFPEWEAMPFLRMFPQATSTALNEWRCIVAGV